MHVEGVLWSQSVWDSHSQRKLLWLVVEEEVGVQGWRQGECWFFMVRSGGVGWELEKGTQPNKRSRKEEAQKVHCWNRHERESWERSLFLQ